MKNKSPAFNFYSSDFLTGTMLMTNSQKGKYITLLCLQHQKGVLSENEFFSIVKGSDEVVISKFFRDRKGNYYNERLKKVMEEKELYIEKQRAKANKRWSKKEEKKVCRGNAVAMPKIEIENNNSYVVELVSYVVELLNSSTSKNYSTNSKKTKELIKARYNEGYDKEDFKKVIDNKVSDWLNDKEMNKYLRPETLFGTKFESYLNQNKVTTIDDF